MRQVFHHLRLLNDLYEIVRLQHLAILSDNDHLPVAMLQQALWLEDQSPSWLLICRNRTVRLVLIAFYRRDGLQAGIPILFLYLYLLILHLVIVPDSLTSLLNALLDFPLRNLGDLLNMIHVLEVVVRRDHLAVALLSFLEV